MDFSSSLNYTTHFFVFCVLFDLSVPFRPPSGFTKGQVFPITFTIFTPCWYCGRRCWLLLPKLHHLWHLSWDTLQNRVNPKTCLLLSAESFIGDIGRVARSCHRSTVSIRTLERWAVKMALKIEALKEELRGN